MDQLIHVGSKPPISTLYKKTLANLKPLETSYSQKLVCCNIANKPKWKASQIFKLVLLTRKVVEEILRASWNSLPQLFVAIALDFGPNQICRSPGLIQCQSPLTKQCCFMNFRAGTMRIKLGPAERETQVLPLGHATSFSRLTILNCLAVVCL